MKDHFDRAVGQVYFLLECGLMVLVFFAAHWMRGLGIKETRHDAILLASALLSWVVASNWLRFRKTNIDELPQFWNVLKGNMSVVGPRPHMLSHTEEFSGRVGGYLRRHHVRPGITGWAQVNGWRGPTDTHEALENRVQHDLWYTENWTFWLDLKILFLTLFGSKTQENAV